MASNICSGIFHGEVVAAARENEATLLDVELDAPLATMAQIRVARDQEHLFPLGTRVQFDMRRARKSASQDGETGE